MGVRRFPRGDRGLRPFSLPLVARESETPAARQCCRIAPTIAPCSQKPVSGDAPKNPRAIGVFDPFRCPLVASAEAKHPLPHASAVGKPPPLPAEVLPHITLPAMKLQVSPAHAKGFALALGEPSPCPSGCRYPERAASAQPFHPPEGNALFSFIPIWVLSKQESRRGAMPPFLLFP